MQVDAEAIIHEHYRPGSRLAELLLSHSRWVRDKALAVAARVAHLNPDVTFIAQAALLHDIGIYWTRAPRIHCHGIHPYICHGIIGRHILVPYGLEDHGRVCERHVGVGITPAQIIARRLPLPVRDMQPVTLEEIIICYADKFYSKTAGGQAHTLAVILAELARFGQEQVGRFEQWHRQFNPESANV